MSKERLERIKERVNYHGHLNDEVEWLIEQAERVQELEETNKKNYWIASDFKFENLKLEQQNKELREALEFANDELFEVLHANKSLDVKMFYIENSKRKITESLEGESNE